LKNASAKSRKKVDPLMLYLDKRGYEPPVGRGVSGKKNLGVILSPLEQKQGPLGW